LGPESESCCVPFGREEDAFRFVPSLAENGLRFGLCRFEHLLFLSRYVKLRGMVAVIDILVNE
jgi:hypothetical protein